MLQIGFFGNKSWDAFGYKVCIRNPHMWKQEGQSGTGPVELTSCDTGYSKPQAMLPGARWWSLPIRVDLIRLKWPGLSTSASPSHWVWAAPEGTALGGGSSLQPRQSLKEVPGRLSAITRMSWGQLLPFKTSQSNPSPCPPQPPNKDIKTHTIWYQFIYQVRKDG